jgi:DNA-binding transcriptional MerR regulator
MLDLSARSIRYYEELGLINPSRSDGGFRLYTEHDLGIIRMILRFKDLGLALEEIRALIGPREGPLDAKRIKALKDAPLLRRDEFEERIERYRQGIEQIDAVIEQLSRCGRCGVVMERETCSNCMSDSGEDISPILDRLL